MSGLMKKIHSIPILAVLVIAISFSSHEVYGTSPSITVSPTSLSVGDTLTVSGSDFIPEKTVYVFLDSQMGDHVVVAVDGSFIVSFPIPTSVEPGPHSITVSYNSDGSNPLTLPVIITIIESIPEFPFSFNLAIIFVAVAAVYLVIRQKMPTNFKRY